MLQRKVLNQLNNWKNKPKKKSLVITGARQVGKTFAVREFAKTYGSYIELNFLEHPEFGDIFSGALDVNTLKLNISVSIGNAVFSDGDTLILLDEIQACGPALQSLKFWTEDARYDVIATGFALGMSLDTDVSYPVGSVEYIDMHSLDFEEFMWAKGMPGDVSDVLKKCIEELSPVPAAVHNKLTGLLREYMVIGGMHEVVEDYVVSGSVASADEIQRRIYREYINDIAHYAPANIRLKAQSCYRSIPLQLTKDNHKFQYSVVEHKATASKFETSIDWLNSAFITKPVYGLKRIEFPLKAFADETNFRLYNTDIGMLMAGFDISMKQALLAENTLEDKSFNVQLGLAKGGLFEALVCDMLIKRGLENVFFYKDVKSTAEIEFVIETEEGVIPIEVKAGRKKANSLNNLLKDDAIKKGYKLSMQNVGSDGKRITLPVYMLAVL